MDNARDSYSRHQTFLEKYYNGQVNKFLPFLRSVAAIIRKQLQNDLTSLNRKRYNEKLSLIESLVNAEYKEFTKQLSGEMKDFSASEADFAAGFFDDADNGVNLVLPSPRQTIAAVKARPFLNTTLTSELNNFSKSQSALIKNAINTGFLEGKTTAEIVKEVIGTASQKFKDGTLRITATKAERMVRTSLAHVASETKNSIFVDNEDLIPYYEWVSTLDGITSTTCKGLDGQVWRVGKGPLPPAHPNCRATTSPLLEEDVKVSKNKKGEEVLKRVDQGGERASQNGPVDGNLNYNDWLGKQSKEFQVETLGPSRAKLFRDGNLKMDKFINDKNEELTLDELRSKYPTAWKKASI